jgi:cysteine synthase A
MVTLIHNVLTTDYVMLIHDDDCVVGLDLLQQRRSFIERLLHLAESSLRSFEGVFGISGLCNILGAIRLARYLHLGPTDNVVTIATDGFDRYPSVLADLAKRKPLTSDASLRDSFERIFRGGSAADILDVRLRQEKERLFGYKQETWSRFGYSDTYLESMKSQSFWDAEAAKVSEYDALLRASRSSG